jgi:hypothetical protein
MKIPISTIIITLNDNFVATRPTKARYHTRIFHLAVAQ